MLTASTLFVGAALLWAGVFKAFARSAPVAAVQSGLPVWLYRTVGAVELATAVAVFIVPIVAVPLALGFLVFLGYRKVTRPESSCGCTSAQPSPIGVRHFARAGLLLAAAVHAVIAAPASLQAALVVSALELLVFALVSPDLDRWWLYPLRRLKVKLTHPLADTATGDIPLLATVQQLQRSEAFRRVGGLLRSDVVESWDEGEWRILRYTIGHEGELADAVFAVPRLTDEPDRIKLAIVAR